MCMYIYMLFYTKFLHLKLPVFLLKSPLFWFDAAIANTLAKFVLKNVQQVCLLSYYHRRHILLQSVSATTPN